MMTSCFLEWPQFDRGQEPQTSSREARGATLLRTLVNLRQAAPPRKQWVTEAVCTRCRSRGSTRGTSQVKNAPAPGFSTKTRSAISRGGYGSGMERPRGWPEGWVFCQDTARAPNDRGPTWYPALRASASRDSYHMCRELGLCGGARRAPTDMRIARWRRVVLVRFDERGVGSRSSHSAAVRSSSGLSARQA